MGIARPAYNAAQVALATHGADLPRARAAAILLTNTDGILAACQQQRRHVPGCPALIRRPVLFPQPAHLGPFLPRWATTVICADGEQPASPTAIARRAPVDMAGRAFLPAILRILGPSCFRGERTELRYPSHAARPRRLCRVGLPAKLSCPSLSATTTTHTAPGADLRDSGPAGYAAIEGGGTAR